MATTTVPNHIRQIDELFGSASRKIGTINGADIFRTDHPNREAYMGGPVSSAYCAVGGLNVGASMHGTKNMPIDSTDAEMLDRINALLRSDGITEHTANVA